MHNFFFIVNVAYSGLNNQVICHCFGILMYSLKQKDYVDSVPKSFIWRFCTVYFKATFFSANKREKINDMYSDVVAMIMVMLWDAG